MSNFKKDSSENIFLSNRGFGQKIGFGNSPALIVIDMLNAFTDDSLPLGTNQDHEIKIIQQILNMARKIKIPIFFTVVEYDDKNLSDAGVWYRKQSGLSSLRAGTNEVLIDNRLEKKSTEQIIFKKYASAFFGTDLVSRLNSNRIDTVILVGCTTSGCVRATAVDAIQLGFIPIVVEDAVSDRSKSAHSQSLFDLNAKYADVIPSKEVIEKYWQYELVTE